VGFAVILIYLILCSLYASFVTPVTILTALPLALTGAFYALYITNEVMTIFATLGIFLLLGVSGKNSILLVDFANQMMSEGKSRTVAIIAAGKARLRPILMTSFALIAGTMPIAIGLNEASKMRTAMGWAIVGGLISSTILTLIVVPAIFSYVDRYRVWSKGLMAKLFFPKAPGRLQNGKGEEIVVVLPER
ncbi:MAG: efflux RND transporter permease subunit, partial [Pseudobdellovibrionaceae bacterium]